LFVFFFKDENFYVLKKCYYLNGKTYTTHKKKFRLYYIPKYLAMHFLSELKQYNIAIMWSLKLFVTCVKCNHYVN